MKKIVFLPLLLLPLLMKAQLKTIGEWTEHLPFQRGTSITSSGNIIYCGTTTGLFSFNSSDNSIKRYSKVDILSEIEVANLAFSSTHSILIVGYANANIDIIENNRSTNLPFIKNSDENQLNINEINIVEDKAYLSLGFGIVVIDILRKEIVDTYKFGENGTAINVNSTYIDLANNEIFAATDEGIYKASLTSNLLDFNAWGKLRFKSDRKIEKLAPANNSFIAIVDEAGAIDSTYLYDANSFINQPAFSGNDFISFNLSEATGKTILNFSDKTLISQGLNLNSTLSINNSIVVGSQLAANGRLFSLDLFNPLLEFDATTGIAIQSIKPNGPFNEGVFDIQAQNGKVWAVAGGHSFSYGNNFTGGRIYEYDGSQWKSYIDFGTPSLNGKFDILSVIINPENENDVYFGSWGRGLIRYNQQLPFVTYTDANSSLQVRQALASDNWIGTGEGEFDQEGNLWVTNTYNVNALSVRKKNGQWKSFDFSDIITNDETTIYDLVISDEGYKWFTLPKENAIIVFDDNGTIDDISDDRRLLLSEQEGRGNIPGARGIKIEKDKDGLIWIGTSDGIAVQFNPSQIFESANKDFERIVFFDGENNEVVLDNTTIRDIAVDGKNRKWIATENSGIILLSADGKQTIAEFTEENSPLFSNAINAIAVDDKSGEVFIATSKGLLSYRGDATEGGEDFSDVKVFPNPVRDDYNGSINIQGLIDNSTIKITDVNGFLVNELGVEGGSAIWNGTNYDGKRVSTGVYLLFYSGENEKGSLKKEIGKILFIH